MSSKKLCIFVEGNDDKRLFDYALNQHLYKEFEHIQIITYSQKPDKLVNKYIENFKKSPKFDYIFLADLDSHSFNCIRSRIDKKMSKHPELEKEKTIIVKEEIESWYISGIDNSFEQLKNKSLPERTDKITKEEFDILIEDVSDSRINAMIEIAKSFNCSYACDKNSSFKYFSEKMQIKHHF